MAPTHSGDPNSRQTVSAHAASECNDDRRSVQYEEMFPWEIEHAIAEFPLCYLPLGVLEWHGEHAAVGLDGIKAHEVCVAAARKSGGIVVPTTWWGTDWREVLEPGD